MPFSGIADPEQLDTLRRVLDEYCRAHGLFDDVDRDNAAQRIINLFARGATTFNDLRQALGMGEHAGV